jgi:predicted regulator of Ras-like GTPase activity (Roadblock/LC7/MglB family)
MPGDVPGVSIKLVVTNDGHVVALRLDLADQRLITSLVASLGGTATQRLACLPGASLRALAGA